MYIGLFQNSKFLEPPHIIVSAGLHVYITRLKKKPPFLENIKKSGQTGRNKAVSKSAVRFIPPSWFQQRSWRRMARSPSRDRQLHMVKIWDTAFAAKGQARGIRQDRIA
jgi:hypothetical protein